MDDEITETLLAILANIAGTSEGVHEDQDEDQDEEREGDEDQEGGEDDAPATNKDRENTRKISVLIRIKNQLARIDDDTLACERMITGESSSSSPPKGGEEALAFVAETREAALDAKHRFIVDSSDFLAICDEYADHCEKIAARDHLSPQDGNAIQVLVTIWRWARRGWPKDREQKKSLEIRFARLAADNKKASGLKRIYAGYVNRMALLVYAQLLENGRAWIIDLGRLALGASEAQSIGRLVYDAPLTPDQALRAVHETFGFHSLDATRQRLWEARKQFPSGSPLRSVKIPDRFDR